jgi:oleandomycin transport system ATP-binding protein
MTYAIEAKGLVKRFGATVALAGADLAVKQGTVLGVLGPNGAGKTTAVRILATLTEPDEGRATVGGFDVVTQAHEVRQLIALTGQYAAVDEGLTGAENLVMIGRLLNLSRPDAKARGQSLLARFDLADAADRPVRTYSGGMRRRLDLAASLVGHPAVLYLDEPSTGLDPRARDSLWDAIRGLLADGTTILLTTQYLEEADQLADSIAVIDRGTVVATGTSNELKQQVGGQVLEVSPIDAADAPAITTVMRDLTGREPDTEAKAITTPINDPAIPPAIYQRLADDRILLAEFSVRRASLDEVFFALTGHKAESDDTDDHTERSAA